MRISVRLFGIVVGFSLACVAAAVAQDELKSVQITAEEPPAKVDSAEPITLDQGVSLNPKLLSVVDEMGEGIVSAERDVYFRALKLARETSSQTFEQAVKTTYNAPQINPDRLKYQPENFPPFRDLVQNPAAYRGKVVSLRGTIRRLTKFESGENNHGIQEVYIGWFYTADSNSNPAVVIFTKKPPELSLGRDITDEIRATGYFFKMYSYESEAGPTAAPLLLASTVEWHPPPNRFVFQTPSIATYVVITLVLLVIIIAMRSGNRSRRIARFDPNTPIDLSHLEGR